MDYSKMWSRFIEDWQLKSLASLVFTSVFGKYNAALGALISLWVMDWVTRWWVISRKAGGFVTAWKTDAISSRGMRDGLKKAIIYIVFIYSVRQLEAFRILGYTLGDSVTEAACAYLALIEFKSIMENLRDLGWEDAGLIVLVLGRKKEQIAGQVVGMQTVGAINPVNQQMQVNRQIINQGGTTQNDNFKP